MRLTFLLRALLCSPLFSVRDVSSFSTITTTTTMTTTRPLSTKTITTTTATATSTALGASSSPFDDSLSSLLLLSVVDVSSPPPVVDGGGGNGAAVDTAVFLVGVFPFLVATWEFWRRIAVGASFGTGADSVVIIGEDDAPASSRGRRALGKGALVVAYVLFAVAALSVGVAVYSVATTPPPPPPPFSESS